MSVASDITIVRSYCTRTSAQTLRLADALVRLSTAGESVRTITAAIADTDAPIGKTRIALIVKTRKAHPTADADQFTAALKSATAANTARKTPADVTAEPVSPEGTDAAAAVTAALAPVTTDAPTHTLDSLTDRLADLMADARAHLTRADLYRFLQSVAAEADESVMVTIPVAA